MASELEKARQLTASCHISVAEDYAKAGKHEEARKHLKAALNAYEGDWIKYMRHTKGFKYDYASTWRKQLHLNGVKTV